MLNAVLTPDGLYRTKGPPGKARPVPPGPEHDRLIAELDQAHRANDAWYCMACGQESPCGTRELLDARS